MNQRSEILVIDPSVENYQSLMAGLPARTEVLVLDSAGDALAQMATLLAGRTGIDALHIISHGSSGQLLLGRTTLNATNLADYAGTLSAIGNSLSANADLLLYGCQVAHGDSGRAFVQTLRKMTGLKIAAATHKVGAEMQGGRWELDDAPVMTSKMLGIGNWQGVLAIVSQITLTEGPSDALLSYPVRKINVGYMDGGTIQYYYKVTLDNDWNSTGTPNIFGALMKRAAIKMSVPVR